TYAEVNDHLPDDIVDPEQIEDIIGMINDMGITVHEVAPDPDTLLLSDTAVAADDDEAEEAAAALAAVDSEFGRTTDPVRMYMREMGTVELLTREGEIELAKRIEEGLDQVITAVSSYPESARILLDMYAKVESGEVRLSDVVSGFRDSNSEGVLADAPEADLEAELVDDEAPDVGDDEDDEESTSAVVDSGPDPELAAELFARLRDVHNQMVECLAKEGSKSARAAELRQEMGALFLSFKFAPRVIDSMVEELRRTIERIRGYE